jgi:hypothetical protein
MMRRVGAPFFMAGLVTFGIHLAWQLVTVSFAFGLLDSVVLLLLAIGAQLIWGEQPKKDEAECGRLVEGRPIS